MDQKSLDELLLNHHDFSKEQLIEILFYIDERIQMDDGVLMGLSQSRLLANFHAYAKVCLNLLKGEDLASTNLTDSIKEACYGIDSNSRRELQSD